MKIEGRLLLFDVVHPDGSIFPSDCKIDIPEKVPIVDGLDFYDNNRYLGYATVSNDGRGLIFTGEVNDDAFITEFYSGCTGYYVNFTSEPPDRLFLNNSKRQIKRKITNMGLKAIGLFRDVLNSEYTVKKKETMHDV